MPAAQEPHPSPRAAGADRRPAGTPDPEAGDPARTVRSDDDRDVGWGDEVAAAEADRRDRRWYDEQRPPHWD